MFRFTFTTVPWLVLVAVLSLAPRLPRVPGISQDLAAVTGHFAIYAALAALIYWLHMRLRPNVDQRPGESAFISAGVAAVIGLGFEWSQQLFTTGRTFQAEDVIANTAGAVSMSAFLLMLETSGSRLRLLLPSVFLLGASLTAFTTASYVIWDPTLPYAGEHWHAAYRVVICGELQPLFPASSGSIHTHGGGGIHIHPEGGGDEGKNANLAAFFRSVDGSLTNSGITLPSGVSYSNGDTCPDGLPGFVSVSQFNVRTSSRFKTVTEPADYVPRNFETLLIEFGPVPDDGT